MAFPCYGKMSAKRLDQGIPLRNTVTDKDVSAD